MELLTSHSSSDAHHSGSIAASQSPERLMTAKENAGLLQAMRPSVLEQRFRSQLPSVWVTRPAILLGRTPALI
jgi:hypothetical protein